MSARACPVRPSQLGDDDGGRGRGGGLSPRILILAAAGSQERSQQDDRTDPRSDPYLSHMHLCSPPLPLPRSDALNTGAAQDSRVAEDRKGE